MIPLSLMIVLTLLYSTLGNARSAGVILLSAPFAMIGGILAQRQALTQAFHDHGLARLPQLQQMAEDAYTLGQGSILELIDSIQSITEHHLAWLNLSEALLQAELDVRFAAGEMMVE